MTVGWCDMGLFSGLTKLLSGGVGSMGGLSSLDPLGLFKKPEVPQIDKVDAAAEQAAADNKAAAAANAKAAQRRRSQASGSLLSTGAAGSSGATAPAQTQSILAYGKSKLGQ